MRRLAIYATALLLGSAACTVKPEPAMTAQPNAATAPGADRLGVSIVTDPEPGLGAQHGLRKLEAALAAKKVACRRVGALADARGQMVVVAGLAQGRGPAAEQLKAQGVTAPEGPEVLVLRRAAMNGRKGLVVAGSDDRGLMYALLDVADRVGWAADGAAPFSEVRDTTEQPYVVERALSVYTMHRGHFESFFYDEAYWARYLDLLARNRFNTFVLIFGYENGGYFAPPYPYFFDLAEFPDIRVQGITPKKQKQNLDALNRLIRLVHERGLRFTLGIWDHIYRGGVQGPTKHARRPTPGLVWGLTSEKLVPYTKVALARFLRLVPDIDAIQFRMHGESGLKRGEMPPFWENIYRVINEVRPGIRFDARAKNFPHALIDRAVEMGINIRICTKYWAEQMGLPFHPTHVNRQNQRDRRHGYADLLRYPKNYDIHWRLWNGGTTRILLWGDPDYVRRFAASTHLYGGQGFEVNEMLATKMQDQPHDLAPFPLLGAEHRYTDYEFERYWHFYQVFGRLGYNPATQPEVWRREFERRFGKDAAPFVERGLHRASQILPRIVATCFPYKRFPMTRGWVEKQRRENLPEYARAEGSDTQQFMSIDEAARLHLEGKPTVRLHPLRNSEWYARVAAEVREAVAAAEKRIGDRRSKEFASTMVDLRILANLALYHSRRIHAALAWSFYRRTRDLHALDDAIRHEGHAIDAWQQIVEAAGEVYHHDLMFGRRRVDLTGHWRDEIKALRRGLARLKAQRQKARPTGLDAGPRIAHVPVRRGAPGRAIPIRATLSGKDGLQEARVGVGGKGSVAFHAMKKTGEFLYAAEIPAAAVREGLTYFIDVTDGAGRRARWPAEPIAVFVTNDDEPPQLSHEPITSAPAETPLTVKATVRDPTGVKWVRLRYRSVTQFEDYRSLPMKPTGKKNEYRATVPAEHIPARWDFMYFFEVMDKAGNGRIYPDFEREAPYIVVKLQR